MAEDLSDPPDADHETRLLRLLYVSHATGPLSTEALRALEAGAVRRNAAAGITGLLIAQEPYFYGLMEGPEGPLLDLMETIITDPRHRSLRILSEEHTLCRRCHDWRLFDLPGGQQPDSDPPLAPAFIFELSRRLGSS